MNGAGRPQHFARLRAARRVWTIAIDPSRPLAAQGDAFWWGRGDILDLSAPFEGFGRVIRGTDRQRPGLVEREFAVSLDAAAGYGGRLIAACFGPSGAVLDRVEA